MAVSTIGQRFIRQVFLAGILLIALQSPALAAITAEAAAVKASSLSLDMVWILTAATLVLLMQIGFMLLEAGAVRSKNSINVAQKNLLDFAVAAVGFSCIGFMLAFAPAAEYLPVGWSMDYLMLSNLDKGTMTFFLFQVMFCGTAATIVSGAVAERMHLRVYLICSLFVAVVIYPVFAHWAWGSAQAAGWGAFLGNMGFVDFAGSTVVHATGAWVALAACIALGPRKGKFDAEGKPCRLMGHNYVLSTAGAFFLFVGWIGFNGGSTISANGDVPHIVLNTVLAGACGTLIGYLLSISRDTSALPEKSLNGMLGGLVAVTAGCMVLDTKGAMIIGTLGGAGAIWFNSFLERRFKLDDAVGAIGVHGCAGVLGTILLAFLAPVENLPLGTPLAQAGVQAIGSAINFAWTFMLSFALFFILKRVMTLRVTTTEETAGMNESEHATRYGTAHLEATLGSFMKERASVKSRLEVNVGDEMENLTLLFNRLMDRLEEEEQHRQHQAEQQHVELEASRMNELANATFEGLCIIRDGQILDCNQSFENMISHSLEDIKGRALHEFVLPSHRESLEDALTAKNTEAHEVELLTRQRERIPVELRCREIIYQGAKTLVLAIVDLRERKQSESRIFHMAQHDTLTDLPNRALFNKHLSETLMETRTGDAGFSLHFIDLDRFKDINDLHGHLAGDAVIKETANRLRSRVGPEDMVARLGGDEFAIIQQTKGDKKRATQLASEIVHAIHEPLRISDGVVLRSGTSVGIVNCISGDDSTQEAVLRRADTALYHAKNSGRNCYAIFEEGMDAERKERQSIEQDLHDAIEHGELENHYQPRMDVSSGEIVSYEALVRWNHPWRGLLGPNIFIPVAEQSRKIIEIGDWVMRRACLDAMEHMEGRQVSVNVSPVQLRDINFSIRLEAILKETGLPPSRLELEVTENLLIEDDDAALKMLNVISAMGVRIALDDFGTGFSSLSYLSRFQFNTVKIDRSFIRHVDEDLHSIAIVDSIFSLAHALKMRVVAEGVEDHQQFMALSERRCDEIQGYLIGRPLPIGELAKTVPEELQRENYLREQVYLPI